MWPVEDTNRNTPRWWKAELCPLHLCPLGSCLYQVPAVPPSSCSVSPGGHNFIQGPATAPSPRPWASFPLSLAPGSSSALPTSENAHRSTVPVTSASLLPTLGDTGWSTCWFPSSSTFLPLNPLHLNPHPTLRKGKHLGHRLDGGGTNHCLFKCDFAVMPNGLLFLFWLGLRTWTLRPFQQPSRSPCGQLDLDAKSSGKQPSRHMRGVWKLVGHHFSAGAVLTRTLLPGQ